MMIMKLTMKDKHVVAFFLHVMRRTWKGSLIVGGSGTALPKSDKYDVTLELAPAWSFINNARRMDNGVKIKLHKKVGRHYKRMLDKARMYLI